MDDESGLLNIHLSDSEDEVEATASIANGDSSARRTEQSEAAFQAVKASYRAKVQNGNLYKSISLPLDPVINKQHAQDVLHAAEELCFFRRYAEAAAFISEVLRDANAESLGSDVHGLLRVYEVQCKQRLKASQAC